MDIDEYLKGILRQVLDSYKILAELNDDPIDLNIIKKEIKKKSKDNIDHDKKIKVEKESIKNTETKNKK